jgi:hypothetical protein
MPDVGTTRVSPLPITSGTTTALTGTPETTCSGRQRPTSTMYFSPSSMSSESTADSSSGSSSSVPGLSFTLR